MPKRTNAFQRFVRDLESLLAPDGGTVEESALIIDRSTGSPTEVDVVVRYPAGPRTVVVGIECRDHRRPQDVTWIDQLNSRKQNLELDRIVAASRSGFTRNAEEKARMLGIDIIKMNAKKIAKWISSFAYLQFIQIKEDISPFLWAIRVRFLDESDFQPILIEESRKTIVIGNNNTKIGTLAALGDAAARYTEVTTFAKKKIPALGDHHFSANYRLNPGFSLEYKGQLRSLAEIEMGFRVIRRIRTVPFSHIDYGDAQAVVSEFAFLDQGKMKLILAQSEGQTPKMSLTVDRNDKQSPKKPGKGEPERKS